MPEMLSREFLNEHGWNGIRIGKHIVSYCKNCGCQRVKYCVDKSWADDDWLFEFRCPECELVPKDIFAISKKELPKHLRPNVVFGPVDEQERKRKHEMHLSFLEDMAMDLNFHFPDENVVVDKKMGCLVWKKKGDIHG